MRRDWPRSLFGGEDAEGLALVAGVDDEEEGVGAGEIADHHALALLVDEDLQRPRIHIH